MHARAGAPLAVLLVVFASGRARAQDTPRVDVGGVLDTRVARTDAARAWVEGGPGRLRWGGDGGEPATLAALGQASLLVDAHLTETLLVHLQANLDADRDPAGHRQPAGLVEGYAAWRPEPSPHLRFRAKLGVFFPPISAENTGPGWSVAHTITPSAINSWVGEELRTVGAEARLAVRARDHELWALGAVFSWNDPAGSLLAWRGWALHDAQTKVGDRLALPPLAGFAPSGPFPEQARWVEPVREIDGRLGWYAGAGWRAGSRLTVSALRWDNAGVPTRIEGGQYAWATAFTSATLEGKLGPLDIAGQGMDGRTRMGLVVGPTTQVDATFQAAYGLVALAHRRHRVTARYDQFRMRDRDVLGDADRNEEDGHAWTAAYAVTVGGSHRLALEWVEVTSSRPARSALGLAQRLRQRQAQASVRIVF